MTQKILKAARRQQQDMDREQGTSIGNPVSKTRTVSLGTQDSDDDDDFALPEGSDAQEILDVVSRAYLFSILFFFPFIK